MTAPAGPDPPLPPLPQRVYGMRAQGPNSPGPGSSPGGTGSITGSGSPSLAVQIREIASTLRHINALRIEYMDKIQEQVGRRGLGLGLGLKIP